MAKQLPQGMRWHRGKIQVRYRDPQGKVRGKSFDRLHDARRFQTTNQAKLLEGKWLDPVKGRVRFGVVAERWLASRSDLRASTEAIYDIALRNYLLPQFGQMAISRIGFEEVESFQKQLLSQRSPATTSKYVGVLSMILDYALKAGHIDRNPCNLVRGPGDKEQKDAIFLEADEVNQLAEAIHPRFKAMVLVAAWRGPRFGELAGLRTENLNLLHSRLRIVETLNEVRGGHSFGPPKTKEGKREILLPPFLVEALETHLENFPPVNEVVFTAEDGSLLRRSNFRRRIFRPAVRRAGLNPDLTFHGLRHTAASLLIASGASILEVAAILGWARNSMVAMAARYSHLTQQRDEELTRRIEAAYRATSQS